MTGSAYKMIQMCVAMQRNVGMYFFSILVLQHAFTWTFSHNAMQAKICELGFTSRWSHLVFLIVLTTFSLFPGMKQGIHSCLNTSGHQ